jgi:hypothetical protein
MTDDEHQSVRTSGTMTPDDWAWVFAPVMSAAFFGWLLGVLLRKLLGVGPYTSTLPILMGCLFGSLGAYGSVFVYRLFAQTRSESEKDELLGEVDVIEIREPRVVQQEESNDEGPIYYFDIGEGKLLFLWGQWLYDPYVFWQGGHSFAKDEGSQSLGEVPPELPEPPFPNSSFILHRTRNLGRVTRIDLLGDRISPETTIPASAVGLSDLAPSCILDGSLQDLSTAVAGAARRRPNSAHAADSDAHHHASKRVKVSRARPNR